MPHFCCEQIQLLLANFGAFCCFWHYTYLPGNSVGKTMKTSSDRLLSPDFQPSNFCQQPIFPKALDPKTPCTARQTSAAHCSAAASRKRPRPWGWMAMSGDSSKKQRIPGAMDGDVALGYRHQVEMKGIHRMADFWVHKIIGFIFLLLIETCQKHVTYFQLHPLTSGRSLVVQSLQIGLQFPGANILGMPSYSGWNMS